MPAIYNATPQTTATTPALAAPHLAMTTNPCVIGDIHHIRTALHRFDGNVHHGQLFMSTAKERCGANQQSTKIQYNKSHRHNHTLSDRTVSSSVAIEKYMQYPILLWMNATFLKALNDGVESGALVKVRGSLGKL